MTALPCQLAHEVHPGAGTTHYSVCNKSKDNVNGMNNTNLVTIILRFLESSENLQSSCGSLTS